MGANHSSQAEIGGYRSSPEIEQEPSTYDCDLQLIKAIEKADMREAEDWILKFEANANAICQNGDTVLMFAATIGSASCTALLLEMGADVDARKRDGSTALMDAASRGNADSVRLLLSHGADVNATNNNGSTALMMAALGGDTGSLQFLLNYGADTDAMQADGNTAWMLATKFGSVDCLRALLGYADDLDSDKVKEAIDVAVSNGRYESAEILRSHIWGTGGGRQQNQRQQNQRQQNQRQQNQRQQNQRQQNQRQQNQREQNQRHRRSAEATAVLSGSTPTPPAVSSNNPFDSRCLETQPFTKSELESMNNDELRAVKFRLGMGSFGPIPITEFADTALAIQESLYAAPSATPMPPLQAPSSSGTLQRLTSSSSRNPTTGQMECGICLSPMGGSENKAMAAPPCGHVYCYDCLLTVVRAAREGGHSSGSCPMCRHQYTKSQVLKLFVP